MALVPCPDCSKEVSPDIKVCPDCGCNVKKRLKAHQRKHKNCKKCNEEMLKKKTTCPNCGKKNFTETDKFLMALGCLFLFGIIGALTREPSSSSSSYQTTSAPKPSLLATHGEKFAAMVNMSGQLCAKPTSLVHKGNDRYILNCIEYRNGNGRVEYFIDLNEGKVVRM